MPYARLLLPMVLMVVTCTAGCRDDRVLDDLAGTSFTLVDADSTTVAFPDAFEGQITLVGFVYTHCPDICPMTTSNMRRVREQLGAPEDVQFVTITFDPARDTPEVLRGYRDAYNLDDTSWRFLTGPPETIAALMKRMGIRYERSYSSTTEEGEEVYFIDHTDQVTLLDARGRVVREYGGSMTPPEILVEDITALRNQNL